jgi:DNA-directed RNA polymerase alpha subunit
VIRAVHARGILDALVRTAEAGPVFDAIYECLSKVNLIVKEDEIESYRDRPIEDLEISIRLGLALSVRAIKTVRQLEATTAEALMKSSGSPGSSSYFGKKCLRETREVLASLGMKLKGDS